MKFFKNPPRRAKRKKKKRRTAAQVAATRKLVARNKARGKKKKSVKRRRVNSGNPSRKKGTTMAARKRREGTVRRTTAKRRGGRKRGRRKSSGNISLKRVSGKVYRSNPSGIVKQVVQGAKDSVLVMGGGAAVRAGSNLLPLPANLKAGYAGAAVQTAVALAVSMAARRFLGGDAARMVLAGAMQVPVKSVITSLVPAAAPLLGDYDGFGAYLDPMGSYPSLSGGSDASALFIEDDMGSYPDGSY